MMIYSYPCGLELRLHDCCALELACNCALQGYFLGRKSLGQEALDVHTFHRHEERTMSGLRKPQ